MKLWKHRQRFVGAAMILALLASLTLGSASSLAMVDQDLVVNGNFEGGFVQQAGCGMVGKGWACFTNGGTVDYGFYDDQWAPVVADGSHSQLLELSTLQYAASEADRFAGISQTVSAVKGSTYTLKLKGLMRERGAISGGDAYRYRVQWGYTADGSTDWTKVTNWAELPWDKIDERTAPTGMESFSTTLKAPSAKLTLFVRVWKKWGSAYKELDVNLDAISLTGKVVKTTVTPSGKTSTAGTTGTTGTASAGECSGANLVANGNFEGGFVNGVGKGWTSFTNGGAAAYGFYDEMWAPVIKDGKHGQLIEINTKGLAAADPDRYAGIYQVVGKLTKGAVYEFSLYGMLREDASHSGEDAFRYRVQWGYAAADADPSAADITNWAELSWDQIYPRTAPGALASYSAKLTAPADKIVVAVRAWKKWGTVQRELDVNLDAIRLASCTGGSAGECVYVVQRGNSLGGIAAKYGTTVANLVKLNGLKNANFIVVGQKLKVPCAGGAATPPPAVVTPTPAPAGACIWVVVQRGDTVSQLAAKYRSTVALIVQKNGLKDANRIYVGQKLCIIDP